MLLRLLCAIKCLLYPSLYDSSSADVYAQYRADEALVLPSYDEFVNETLQNVAYSDMLTVLCLSTVIQKLIQTRWPITIHTSQESPLTKLAVGRNVQPSRPFFDHIVTYCKTTQSNGPTAARRWTASSASALSSGNSVTLGFVGFCGRQ